MKRYETYEAEVNHLLETTEIVSVGDFAAVMKELPQTAINARILALEQNGRIVRVGKGLYQAVPKPHYATEITPEMKDISAFLIDSCEGVDFCITRHPDYLEVIAPRHELQTVQDALKAKYGKVLPKSIALQYVSSFEGYIVLSPLVSESPLFRVDNVAVPTLEMQIVDNLYNHIHTGQEWSSLLFQKTMEVYPVNENKLIRYASRRGIGKELKDCLAMLDKRRMQMINTVQKYLSTTAITKAWIFGSFARGEETDQSDLDLLVDYDTAANPSLLTLVRYQLDLEKRIGRHVDLVENGYLLPFASQSAEKDKYLLYERKA